MGRASVVFDLDGTLADTSGDLLAAANACFRALGLGDLLHAPADNGTALRGGKAMLRLGFTRVAGFGEGDVEAQYPELLAHYARALSVETSMYPDAIAATAELKRRGYGVGICTNKPAVLAERLLKELEVREAFDVVLGSDSLPVKKPDPEHLRETVRRMGCDPRRTCLVGDSETDRKTALRAGVPSILVTFGPAGGNMAALAPAALLPDYAMLPDLVERLIGAP